MGRLSMSASSDARDGEGLRNTMGTSDRCGMTPPHKHIFIGCFGEQTCFYCHKTRRELGLEISPVSYTHLTLPTICSV